jgi:hypothetical protein
MIIWMSTGASLGSKNPLRRREDLNPLPAKGCSSLPGGASGKLTNPKLLNLVSLEFISEVVK